MASVPASLDELPEVLTVEEAAAVLRIGRGAAYELARRWRESNGREGLPVVPWSQPAGSARGPPPVVGGAPGRVRAVTDSDRRALRRRLGPVAWCVLEDLIEDARVNSLGRRVATSSVRRLADNLGVSKDTTARALRRLTSAELIAALPAPRADRGRFGGGAYLVCAAASREDTAVAGERSVAPPASRRPRARSAPA